MGQWFDAFIPGVYEDDIPALEDFCERAGIHVHAYDKVSNVFSLSIKNTIYSLYGNHWEEDGDGPIAKFLSEFRATKLESYRHIEIFVRPEMDDYWHSFAHSGERRKCCHINTAEAISAMEKAEALRREVYSIHAENSRLRGNIQQEVNARVKKFIDKWLSENRQAVTS